MRWGIEKRITIRLIGWFGAYGLLGVYWFAYSLLGSKRNWEVFARNYSSESGMYDKFQKHVSACPEQG